MPPPGQPVFVHEFSPTTRFGSAVTPIYTDVTNRVHSKWTAQHGQQYQRSQAQAGTYNATWRNNDGFLDPLNINSPYFPGVTLYAPVRVRAQFPATANFLTGDQATGGELTPVVPGAIPVAMNITAFYGTPVIAASATAWQGTQVYATPVGAAVASGHELLQLLNLPIQATSTVVPATSYAWSAYVRSATSGANPTVAAQIQWMNVVGGLMSVTTGAAAVLTGSSTAAFTRVTVAGTPPAGAVYAHVAVMLTGTVPAGAWSFQADGLQGELGAAASTWQLPGTWYPVWDGAINGDPRAFSGDSVTDSSGNYSVARISGTDVLGCLAQAKLADCYINALLSYGPDFIYTLSDPSYPDGQTQLWNEWTGQRGPATAFPPGPVFNGESGVTIGASVTAGSSATATAATNGLVTVPLGTNGAVVGLAGAQRYYDSGIPNSASWIAAGVSLGQQGLVGPPAATAWTRLVGFQMHRINETQTVFPFGTDTGPPYLRSVVFSCVGPSPNGFPQVSLSYVLPITWPGGVFTPGTPYGLFEAWNASGVHVSQQIFSPLFDDEQWWLAAVSLSADGHTFTINLGTCLSGAVSTATVSTGGVDFRTASATAYTTDTVGAWWAPWQATNTTGAGFAPIQYGMIGQLGAVAELPFAVSAGQFADLFTAFQTAYSGDTTGARVARLLAWGGYTGPSTVDAGSTTMGPAGGLGSSQGPWSGSSVLSALQPVVLAEHGMVHSGRSGEAVFRGRTYRWSQSVPAVVFGEGPPVGAFGEVPYRVCEPGYDPAEVINTVTFNVTSSAPGATSIPVGAFNTASVAALYPQSVQQSVNTLDTTQAQNLASWLANANSVPRDRISTLQVRPSHTLNCWPQTLGLELNRLVQAMRRPLGGNPLTMRAFVENIAWEGNPSGPDYKVTVQASPAMLDAPWVPAAMHTTLHVQANSGASSFTINALPDAAANPLHRSLPQGYQLVLDPANPAITETVTLAPGGIPATTAGYTTATLSILGTLAHTHAAGATVCEVLPPGVTDPTVYDWRSIPAAISSTVVSGGAAGTNTVTISPLADAQTTPLASALPQGWTLWLSPGTPRFETAVVAPGGVPATSPGWKSATVTLTANLAFSHLPSDIVCDPLPAGLTHPAQVNVNATTIPGF